MQLRKINPTPLVVDEELAVLLRQAFNNGDKLVRSIDGTFTLTRENHQDSLRILAIFREPRLQRDIEQLIRLLGINEAIEIWDE